MIRHPFFREEHEALRQAVREFVQRHLAPHAEEWERAGAFPKEVFRQLGQQGLLGLAWPEAYGGQGLDYFSTVVFVEELSRCGMGGLPMGVMVHTDMATPPLLQFGSEALKRRYLPEAARGDRVFAIGITEPFAGSDVAGIRTTARREGDHYVINGSKTFITNGVQADAVTLVVKTDPAAGRKGISLLVVEKGTPGFSVARKLEKVGMWSSDTGELVFEDCRVPVENLVGQENQGFYYLMWELQGERLVIAVATVAMAQEALDLALAYVKERNAFGQPIGRFQAIQHRLADMAAELEAARQLVYWACWRASQGEFSAKEISMAKLVATNVAFRIADEALQFHGGYGYMLEYPIQRIWRDVRLYRIGAGTDEALREVIARELGLRESRPIQQAVAVARAS